MNNKSINFKSFTQIMLSNLKERLGEDYTVFAHTVKKNNGIELTGVVISRTGCNTSPTFYIDSIYHRGITEDEIKKEAKRIYEQFQKSEVKEDLDFSDFLDYQKMKEKIAVKLVNAEKNRELLEMVPHKLFYDLALVVYYPVQEAPFEGKASILIYETHREQWGVNEEELLKDAIQNTPRMFPGKIESMNHVMKEIFSSELGKSLDEEELRRLGIDGEELEEILILAGRKSGQHQTTMYVLSNRQKLYGAVCMLYPNILKNFADKIGQDLYILPSSIHEVILVPVNTASGGDELREIVTDINRTQVAEEEVLADNIYYYNRMTDDILMLSK
ncbi:MAG: DUF5688 family protein [Lachnospiraceae bacterium]|nr:DUF5688 family protein [Lachnospiraceae bacterium]